MDSTEPDLGKRLRALRQQKGWRISDVSQMTGLAVSTISKVENGQMSLTYDKLLQLARGLSLDFTDLFKSEAPAPAGTAVTGRRSVGRVSEAVHVPTGPYDHWYLNTDLSHKHMTPIVGEVLARTLEEFGPLVTHPGEEFIYVLEGKIAVHTAFYSPVVLNQGESIYLDSTMGHAYLAADDGPCRFLALCSGDLSDYGEQFEGRTTPTKAPARLSTNRKAAKTPTG
ncbi:helix-turn-helix domain-containing protein [Caulobacter mirabilis]|uniref:XRE family transcriptional regulator n=1 Tax=Caulobacter mirabilis TaxID=69666 RepID=A0A2D2AZF9_9CAUL|nr:XRE family transcriptional regulator [Caulobacter mirabilis]ATQ43371.1 XRE family transcriptional regulator [Caulobacter mirabilis]